jgi:ankyrin repeat protein
MQELLAQGADPNVRNAEGRTALMVALAEGVGDDGIRLFLEKRADVNAVDRGGSTPLMIAADAFKADVVKVLLDRGADTRARDREGNTPLLRAAASRHSYDEKEDALIPALLEKGADPNARNSQGVTALMLTAREGNSALLDLLAKGAAVDARDRAGNTALLYAAGFFVREDPVYAGHALLDAKADVNAANQEGETALMRAATQHEVAGAKLLLDKGAEVNARDRKGRTALMWSIDGPEEFDNTNHLVYSPAIAELLIARGADVNARDVNGNTPLKIASKRGYAKMIQLLREHGAKE